MLTNLYFDRFYSTETLAAMRSRSPKENHDKGVVHFLTAENEPAQMRRAAFDSYLEVGYRHSALDSDLTARLQSVDWPEFVQARNELMAAWFLESRNSLSLSFRPIGRGNSVGEYSFLDKEYKREVFVEVKSPWQKCPAGGFSYGHGGDTIRQCVNQARRQLPKDGRSTLVIIAGQLEGSLSDPLGGMIQALYGEPFLKIAIGPSAKDVPSKEGWKLNGLFQPRCNCRISAVATFEEVIACPKMDSYMINYLSQGEIPADESLPMHDLRYRFHVYHNPYATYPLSASVFNTFPQFLPNAEKNQLEWRDIQK